MTKARRTFWNVLYVVTTLATLALAASAPGDFPGS